MARTINIMPASERFRSTTTETDGSNVLKLQRPSDENQKFVKMRPLRRFQVHLDTNANVQWTVETAQEHPISGSPTWQQHTQQTTNGSVDKVVFDEVIEEKFARVKIDDPADLDAFTIERIGTGLGKLILGSISDVTGQDTKANSLPVTLASDEDTQEVRRQAMKSVGTQQISVGSTSSTDIDPGSNSVTKGVCEAVIQNNGDVDVWIAPSGTGAAKGTKLEPGDTMVDDGFNASKHTEVYVPSAGSGDVDIRFREEV